MPIFFSIATDKNESRILSISAQKISIQQFISQKNTQQQVVSIDAYKIDIERFDGKKYYVGHSPEQQTKNSLYLPVSDNNLLQNRDIVIPSFY